MLGFVRVLSMMALGVLTSLSTATAADKPLQVYILVGQSNMQGQAMESTLAGLAMDPATKALYDKLVDENGKTRVHEHVSIAAFSRTDAWGKIGDAMEKHGPLSVGYGGNLTQTDKLGPELGFGVTMGEHLKEPILIIKTAWGGKSLHTDFRSPSGGPYYEFPDQVQDRKTNKGTVIPAKEVVREKVEATGKYYRLMLEHIRSVLADPGKYCPDYNPKAGVEIAGFVWFQGFNDLVGPYPALASDTHTKGGKDFSQYSHLLACFIRDVRKDLSAPNLPFVIGVLGVGGQNPGENAELFRKAMAAPAELPEFKGTVAVVHTADFWDEKLGELDKRKSVMKVPNGKQKPPIDEYTALREKIAPLQNELAALSEQKDAKSKQKKEQLSKSIEELVFTQEEREYISKNRSNQGYHYLGSAKTYSRIGEAFARVLIEENAK